MHKIGKIERRFQPNLYEHYSWLEYSICKDAVFCFYCRHFGRESKSCVFRTEGFCQWNKCFGTPEHNRLTMHEKSNDHIFSIERYNAYKNMKKSGNSKQNVVSLLDNAHQQEVRNNRHYMRVICDILRLTGCQNLAQRGHFENERSMNRGNFLELLSLVARSDPIVNEKLTNNPQNAKYTSHQMQDALLKIMSDMIMEEIRKEVTTSVYFSLLVDETKDVRKQEQLSIALRYLHNNVVHEEFVGFFEADELNSNSLVKKIKEKMDELGVPISNCVGQGYDGASVMSGVNKGVQTIIREKYAKMAVYMHCCNHRLNLVIVDVLKDVKCARDFFGILQALYTFVSCSTIHSQWMTLQLQLHPEDRPQEMKRLCLTRWSCQIIACRTVLKKLDVILILLHEIEENARNHDRSFEAKVLISNIDESFVLSMILFTEVLGHIHVASKYLQDPTADLSKAAELIDSLQKVFQEMRSETHSDQLFSSARELIEKNNIPPKLPRSFKRTRNMPLKMAHYIVEHNSAESQVGLEERSSSDRDIFRIEMFYPVVDCVINELQQRFSGQNVKIMQCVQAFIPSSPNFLNTSLISEIAEFYGGSNEDLLVEIVQFNKVIERRKKSGKEENIPSTLLQLHQVVQQYGDAFFELERLIRILCTIPVSSASCERSFSTLRLIKTDLRNSIGSERLRDLSIISIHSERAKGLNLDHVIDNFVKLYPRCRISLI